MAQWIIIMQNDDFSYLSYHKNDAGMDLDHKGNVSFTIAAQWESLDQSASVIVPGFTLQNYTIL